MLVCFVGAPEVRWPAPSDARVAGAVAAAARFNASLELLAGTTPRVGFGETSVTTPREAAAEEGEEHEHEVVSLVYLNDNDGGRAATAETDECGGLGTHALRAAVTRRDRDGQS